MMFSLSEIRPQVFHIQCDSRRELGMMFLRYTEHYESKYDHIRGNRFTLVQQQSAYCRDHLGSPDADWTYTSDWSGYNIPAETIEEVQRLGIPDPNHYDALMAGVYGMIQGQAMGKKSYLIGTTTDCQVSTLDHELTHAMFYLVTGYSSIVGDLIYKSPCRLALEKALHKAGYPRKVAVDEIQAYLTTGDGGTFGDLMENEDVLSLQRSLKAVHDQYFPEFSGVLTLPQEAIEKIDELVANPPAPGKALREAADRYLASVFSDD